MLPITVIIFGELKLLSVQGGLLILLAGMFTGLQEPRLLLSTLMYPVSKKEVT